MSTVLVTGASGFVGSHVLPELLDAGHVIRALVRDDAARRTVLRRVAPSRRAAVQFAVGDVTMPETLPVALQGVDAVVHLVAIARDGNGGRDLERINLDGTRHVVEAMGSTGVRRLIHLGGLGVADVPDLHFGRSKARGEEVVERSNLDWTVLKPSLLWGERDGFFNIVAGLARIPVPFVPVPGRGAARFQPLWVGDLARIVRLALERPETIRQRYELGGSRWWTYRELTAEVLRGMGKRRLIVPMPMPLIRLVAGTAERLHLPFPVATDQLRQLRLENFTEVDAVERAFGFAPRPMEGNLTYLRHRPKDQESTPDAKSTSGSGRRATEPAA
jgi:uncharacterized protein YbjT (DUF2867 family)